jgi:hypothetical protein
MCIKNEKARYYNASTTNAPEKQRQFGEIYRRWGYFIRIQGDLGRFSNSPGLIGYNRALK